MIFGLIFKKYCIIKKEAYMPRIKKENGEVVEVVQVIENNELDVLKNEIVELKELNKQLIDERNKRTQELFDRDKEVERLKKIHEGQKSVFENQIIEKDKNLEALSQKFNELAKLFDEYIKGFDDIIELQKLQLRNVLRTQELLQIKIKAFNGEGGSSK
jgi:hypothetical protein